VPCSGPSSAAGSSRWSSAASRSSHAAFLGARRARTLGFGVATYLLFLVPFLAIVVMPAAVAGATLLSRDAIGLPTERPTAVS
jgi:hypothetical protein